jgi:hypothetical protein
MTAVLLPALVGAVEVRSRRKACGELRKAAEEASVEHRAASLDDRTVSRSPIGVTPREQLGADGSVGQCAHIHGLGSPFNRS